MNESTLKLEDLSVNTGNTLKCCKEYTIPGNCGIGYVQTIDVIKGTTLVKSSLSFLQDTSFETEPGSDYFYFCFNYGENVDWINSKGYKGNFPSGKCLVYFGQDSTSRIFCEKGKTYAFRGIRIPLTTFQLMTRKYIEWEDIAFSKRLMNGPAIIDITPRMENILSELKDFLQYQNNLGLMYIDNSIRVLATLCLAELFEVNIRSGEGPELNDEDIEQMMKIKKLIRENLNELPNRDELAKLAGMSPSSFGKCFRQYFGTSVYAYIIDQRLEKAASMLTESKYSIKQISAKVGYSKPSNFTAAFKRKYGVLPKTYRNSNVR